MTQVQAADGTTITLSPTGARALQHVDIVARNGGGITNKAHIHAATRDRLIGAGLITWVGDDHTWLTTTPAGTTAAQAAREQAA